MVRVETVSVFSELDPSLGSSPVLGFMHTPAGGAVGSASCRLFPFQIPSMLGRQVGALEYFTIAMSPSLAGK